MADFRRDAIEKIDQLHQQGKVPVLVGGTMMYFKVVDRWIIAIARSVPSGHEQSLSSKPSNKAGRHFTKSLQLIDPQAAEKMSENDSQRINRALRSVPLNG